MDAARILCQLSTVAGMAALPMVQVIMPKLRQFDQLLSQPEVNDERNERAVVKANLKQLRLPAMHAGFPEVAGEAASGNQTYEQYLLHLTELEVTALRCQCAYGRIKQATFPAHKDLDTYDFSAPCPVCQ